MCERITASTRRWESALASHSPLATPGDRPFSGSRRVRVGTNQVAVGRNGWLFFRPALEHLTGPPSGARAPTAKQPARRPASGDPRLRCRLRRASTLPVPYRSRRAQPELLAAACFRTRFPDEPSLVPLSELEEGGVLVRSRPVSPTSSASRPIGLPRDRTHCGEAATAVAEALAVRARAAELTSPGPWLHH